MEVITSALTFVLTSIGAVVSALFGTSGALAPLLPYFAIGIACSLVLFAYRSIKGLIWGA